MTHILNVTDNIPNYFENNEEDGRKNKAVDIIIEMDQVEYMKISIEDKESVCIRNIFQKYIISLKEHSMNRGLSKEASHWEIKLWSMTFVRLNSLRKQMSQRLI